MVLEDDGHDEKINVTPRIGIRNCKFLHFLIYIFYGIRRFEDESLTFLESPVHSIYVYFKEIYYTEIIYSKKRVK